MEIFSVLLVVLGIILLLKLFSAGLYIISIPIKIAFLLIALILSIVIIIPIGIVTGIFSLLLVPFTVLIPILPIVLIVIGAVLLAKHSN